MELVELWFISSGNAKWHSHFGKYFGSFFYDLAIPHLDTYHREMKTYIHRPTYTQMFKVALFIITKIGNNFDVNCDC